VVSFEFSGDPASENITIVDHFSGTGREIEQFVFSEFFDTVFTFTLLPTAGNDLIAGEALGASIDGGLGDDVIYGTLGVDTLMGSDGNDHLIGDAGSDTLLGGDGNDELFGGLGDDLLDGGAGDDIYGFNPDAASVPNQTITDSGGLDFLEGLFDDDDELSGAERIGNDLVLTFSELIGGTLEAAGSVTIVDHFAGSAIEFAFIDSNDGFDDEDDFLLATENFGTAAPDLIAGTAGADVLTGDDDDDLLFGNGGNDTLIGGQGVDDLFGGAGNDIFRYLDPTDGRAVADGVVGFTDTDVIGDPFVSGADKIQLVDNAFGFDVGTELFIGVNFFTLADYDGTLASFGGGESISPQAGVAYIVFDPNSDTLYADDDVTANGFTSVVTLDGGGALVASDIEIIAGGGA